VACPSYLLIANANQSIALTKLLSLLAVSPLQVAARCSHSFAPPPSPYATSLCE